VRVCLLGLVVWLVSQASPGHCENYESECADPLFIQYAARMDDRESTKLKLAGWDEFLRSYPNNPCASAARARIDKLRASSKHAQETELTEQWKQLARGGLIEPGLEIFPGYVWLADPTPRNRVRLLNELVFLKARNAERAGVSSPLWFQVYEFEASPVYNLTLLARLPMIVGQLADDGYSYDLGNITLGVRGNWGCYLGQDRYPLVVSGGFWWGSGSSLWSGGDRNTILDYAAYAAPVFFPLFRYDQTDYALHAEAQLGLGSHFLAVAIAYHVLAQGKPPAFLAWPRVDPVFQLFRVDLAWEWWLLDWLIPALEFNTGLGFPTESGTAHIYLSPAVRFRLGRFRLAMAVHVPFLEVSDYSSIVISFEAGLKLW